MPTSPQDLAQTRYLNALALFEEFVRQTARHADAATLRGLERRFAERVQIQPSYWSQIKSRSRQIGERLARQFEQQCKKPRGWLDLSHGDGAAQTGRVGPLTSGKAFGLHADDLTPQDEDERFIVGLVMTYYRRHPQRARTRLLDLLGEVLTPPPAGIKPTPVPDVAVAPGGKPAPTAETENVWQRSQSDVAPLKRKR